MLPGLILMTVLLNLAAAYGMNVWNRAIFDALENRDGATVLFLTLVYLPLLVASVLLIVAQVYARMTTQRRWRAWLNNHLLDRWLRHGRYYQLNLISGDHKNPEYRIADDVRGATEAPVDFATGVLNAVLLAATFIVVLWAVGGSLTVEIGGNAITIPGFLVIAAVLYALVASGVDDVHRPRASSTLSKARTSLRRNTATCSRACVKTARASRCSAARRRSAAASTAR